MPGYINDFGPLSAFEMSHTQVASSSKRNLNDSIVSFALRKVDIACEVAV